MRKEININENWRARQLSCSPVFIDIYLFYHWFLLIFFLICLSFRYSLLFKKFLARLSMEQLATFCADCSGILLSNIYPGSPVSRKSTALLLLHTLSDFNQDFHTSDTICILLRSLMDTYLRDLCDLHCAVLANFRAPFATLETKEKVEKLIQDMIQDYEESENAFKAEPAARIVALVHKKYVVELGWPIQFTSSPTVSVVLMIIIFHLSWIYWWKWFKWTKICRVNELSSANLKFWDLVPKFQVSTW